MTRRFFLPLVAALTLAACSHNTLPEGVMDADRMADFLIEAYMLEAYNTVMYRGSTTDLAPDVRAAYDEILRRNGLTRDEVETSLDYYGKHPREYKEILEEVSRRLAD